MAVFPPCPPSSMSSSPQCARRTATAVMAGCYDHRPPRDVLTSLLNGVGPYLEVESREARKRRRTEKKKVKRKLREARKAYFKEILGDTSACATVAGQLASTSAIQQAPRRNNTKSSFWKARPTIHIATMQRSFSVTPSPPSSANSHLPIPLSSRETTPNPSISSTISRTSSKRPRTPDDDEDFHQVHVNSPASSFTQPPRKKRAAAKKGWKGWVEGSPPPSEKLINLDAVPVLRERRTRSGKNFDAICLGKEGWI